jgi:hypothetical protein
MLTLLQRSDRNQIEDFLESVKPQNGSYDYGVLDDGTVEITHLKHLALRRRPPVERIDGRDMRAQSWDARRALLT